MRRRFGIALVLVLVLAFVLVLDVRKARADDCLNYLQQVFCQGRDVTDFYWWWGGCFLPPCQGEVGR